jgi:hypothetical protein
MMKFIAVLLALGSIPAVGLAADPADQGAPLHGAGVMDGKDKPGQDGWSWAPVPKVQAASKSGQTPGEDKARPGAPMKASTPHSGETAGGG